MSVAYLDTSATLKLVVREAESDALFDEVVGDEKRVLVSSWLMHTELLCAIARTGNLQLVSKAEDLLMRMPLVDVGRLDFTDAAGLARLRAADAIHLTVALRLGVDEMFTYDVELAKAATDRGIKALAPGR